MEQNKYLKQYVERLDVSENIINTLKSNKINTLGELSNYKKSELKEMGILANDVNKIEVDLELLGLSLKGSL